MSPRTFVVTVGEAPSRVVVEDVRSRRRAVADELEDVGATIGRLLDASRGQADSDGREQTKPAR